MTVERAVVLAPPEPEHGPMASRLPAYLHPVLGRPLIWHTVTSLLLLEQGPREIHVLTAEDFPAEALDDLPPSVKVLPFDPDATDLGHLVNNPGKVLLVHASASIDQESVSRLLQAEPGAWIGGQDPVAAATLTESAKLQALLQNPEPFTVPNGYLSPLRKLETTSATFLVRTREDLAILQSRIRTQLIRNLMEGGVTFLLPDTVLVDVGVRIGRDTVIYPGVVLEGETTIGDETVIGPGCRIIDSWIGSGVELKGWNYVAHTSVRNRAILEPYVRRGFD